MQNREILNTTLVPLRAMDTASAALVKMADSAYDVLPVVDATTGRYLGMVSMQTARLHEATDDSVLAFREYVSLFAGLSQHIFDTARQMQKHGVYMLPIVDEQGKYMGVVEKSRLYEQIVHIVNLAEYGSLLTVHFRERDFTLSQLVRIIEAEDTLILGLSVEAPTPGNPFYMVCIKLNRHDPSQVVSALRRNNFVVDACSIDMEQDKRYEERADELMHYLNL